jgi:hypothetical protein
MQPQNAAMTLETALSAMKTCTRCHQTKPLDQFRRDRTCKSGYGPRCKLCINEVKRAWYDAHPERKPQASKKFSAPCPYCGHAIKGRVLWERHMAQCPANPPVAWALLAYLKDHATDGLIMPYRDYYAACTRGRLPSVDTLQLVFGAWADVAQWAGLRYRYIPRKRTRPEPPTCVTVDELEACLPGGYLVASVREVGNRVYMMLR